MTTPRRVSRRFLPHDDAYRDVEGTDGRHIAPMKRLGTMLLGTAILVGVPGCLEPMAECYDTGGRDCERIAAAVIDEIPAGASRVIIGAGIGVRAPPYAVVACYPDGTAVLLEASVEEGDVEFRSWDRPEAPASCE